MVMTASTMLRLGITAYDFTLPDVVSGHLITLDTFKNKKALVMMFICSHCPFVEHIQNALAKLGQDYKEQSVGIVAISSNDVIEHPDDSPELLKAMAQSSALTFLFATMKHKRLQKPIKPPVLPIFLSLTPHAN